MIASHNSQMVLNAHGVRAIRMCSLNEDRLEGTSGELTTCFKDSLLQGCCGG